MDILIVKHGALGDVVRTSWLLPGLHERYGEGARVDWLTSAAAADLLRFNPWVDRVLTTASQLRPRYEWILSLDDEQDAVAAACSVPCARLSGALLRNGTRDYTADVAPWFDMGLLSHLGKARADALKVENTASHSALFSAMLGIPITHATFYNGGAREARWRTTLRSGVSGAVFGVNPFAGGRWPSKALPPSALRQLLVDLLGDASMGVGRVVLFAEEPARAEALLGGMSPHLARQVLVPDTSESTLDLAAAIRSLDYLVTTDSLALHLAVAQAVPNLSFYAPTSAAEIETFGSGVKLLSTAPDYCSYRADADNASISVRALAAPAAGALGAMPDETSRKPRSLTIGCHVEGRPAPQRNQREGANISRSTSAARSDSPCHSRSTITSSRLAHTTGR
jgi:heptosyltransferase II